MHTPPQAPKPSAEQRQRASISLELASTKEIAMVAMMTIMTTMMMKMRSRERLWRRRASAGG